MYKEKLQQLKKDIESEEQQKEEREQEQIQKRKQEIGSDVEEFIKVLVSYFKKRRIRSLRVEYKIKTNYISLGIFYMEDELAEAYEKLLNKWVFIDQTLLREVLKEKLNDVSVSYEDYHPVECWISSNKRVSEFCIQ